MPVVTTDAHNGKPPLTRNLKVKVREDAHDALAEIAQRNERSVSAEIRRAIDKHIADEQGVGV